MVADDDRDRRLAELDRLVALAKADLAALPEPAHLEDATDDLRDPAACLSLWLTAPHRLRLALLDAGAQRP